jgi:outer membrane protein
MKKNYEMNKVFAIALLFIPILGITQQKLSAQDAVMRALENNFQMQIAKKQLEIAEKNNSWSEAGAFPTVDLQATIGNSIIDNTNNPFTFTPGLLYARQTTPAITASWNLFAGFSVRISKHRLELLEDQTKGNALVILETTAQDVLKAYFQAVLQAKRLETLETLYQFSKRQLEYENTRKEYGQSNSLSLLSFQNQLLTDSINVIQQRMNYENTLRNMMILMNVDTDEIINKRFPVLSDSLNQLFEAFELNQILNDLKANNQNLKNQYINLSLQEKATSLQRSFLYPVVNLQLGASPNIGNFRSITDNNLNAETQQITYFGNISLRYSLFNNWKTNRAVAVSKIQEEITSLSIRDLENQLTNTAVNLYEMWQIRQQLINIASQNVEFAKKALELGVSRYELGTINSIELSTLQNNYLSAELNYLDNLYQRTELYLEIYRLTGKLGLTYQSGN